MASKPFLCPGRGNYPRKKRLPKLPPEIVSQALGFTADMRPVEAAPAQQEAFSFMNDEDLSEPLRSRRGLGRPRKAPGLNGDETTAKRPRPVVVDAHGLARMLGCNMKAVWQSYYAGLVPAPIIVAGEERWRIEEIKHWVKEGCPPRGEWERRHYRR